MVDTAVFYWHPKPGVLVGVLDSEITDNMRDFLLIKPVQGELPEAWRKADEAWQKTNNKYLPQIIALHAWECPNCPVN
jgi:hypothetical protein